MVCLCTTSARLTPSAEAVEGRAQAKENIFQSHMHSEAILTFRLSGSLPALQLAAHPIRRQVERFVPPSLGPMYAAHTRGPGLGLSEPDRRFAKPLRHNPVVRTASRHLP